MKKSIQRGTAKRAGHDPRAAALRILDRVVNGQESSQAVLDEVLTEASLVPSDKNLCTELVYGYLRRCIRLGWGLNRLLKNPDKLPQEMRLILGLAAYELVYLRIPGYASVDWAVSRVGHRFGQGLSKVANGVLRTFQRELAVYQDPETYAAIADESERLAVLYSLPVWAVRQWREHYGPEKALAYMQAASEQAVPAVRINAARHGADGLRQRLIHNDQGVAAGAHGVAFPQGMPYEVKSLEKAGALSLQSAGVQEALAALAPETWQGPIWDCCAGRGGKSAALLELGLPVTLASDSSAPRLQGLPGELTRLGLAQITVKEADAADPAVDFGGPFATILADVPCTGLGTLARRPEIRLRRQESDVTHLAQTQDRILDAAVARLTADGRIVYLTCTLTAVENAERVQAFLARHQDFSLERQWETPVDSPWHEFFYGAVLRRVQ